MPQYSVRRELFLYPSRVAVPKHKTFVVEDVSPMIAYDSGWGIGTSADSLAGNYSGSTFHVTNIAVSLKCNRL